MGSKFFKGMSKDAVTKEVRRIVANFDFSEEFESSFISDLIAEKHYYCSKSGDRPLRFRKSARAGGGYNFEGFFPEKGWHKVSWTICITPKSDAQRISEILRETISPLMASFKKQHPLCESCGSPAEEVHHAEPSFKEISENAYTLLTKEEVAKVVDEVDFWSPVDFSLRPDNPAVLYVIEAHKTCKLQALCAPCHKAVGK